MTISKETVPMPSREEFAPSSQSPAELEELVRLVAIYDKGGAEALEREFRRLHPNSEIPIP